MIYKEEKISCILINKNHGNLLEKSINSILNQDYKNKEIIIVDGGSTDNSLNIINKYRDQLDVIISEKDKGPADAMNKGFKFSKGQIINFMNSDDQKDVNAFSEVNKHFQKNKHLVDIYFSPFCVSNQQGKVLYKVNHNRLVTFNLHNVLNEQFGFNSFFIKRESFLKLGGLVIESKKNGNIYYSTDRVFTAKAIINNFKFLKMKTTFHQYTAHENSATFSKKNWISMKLEAKKVAKYLLKDPLISKEDQFLIELYELKNIVFLGIIYFSKWQFKEFFECTYTFLKAKSLYFKFLVLIYVFREIIYRLRLLAGLT